MTRRTTLPSAAEVLGSTAVKQQRGPHGNELAKHYLHAGQFFTSVQPTAVTTVLGSCVAVCLWDPTKQIGGINHFQLANWAGKGRVSPRFGNVAIASLIEALLGDGCKLDNMKAKVFGGASVLDAYGATGSRLGLDNVEVAQGQLEEEGIPIVAEDVGGNSGRKLIFYTHDGTAWVKKLQG